MASIRTSAVGFLRGAWGAIISAFAAVTDPLGIAKVTGLVDPQTEWALGDTAMRSIFVAVAVVWAFVWYHRVQNKLDGGHREPNMPLHLACRWIARDSVWASRYRWPDDEWVQRVAREFFSQWHLGRFEMLGINKDSVGAAFSYLPPVMKDGSEFEAHKLCGPEPPTYIWNWVDPTRKEKPRCFYQVRLDRDEVMRVWPRRSFLDRLRRNSPVERIGDYTDIFAQQDAWY